MAGPKLASNTITYKYIVAVVFMLNMMFGTGPVAYVDACFVLWRGCVCVGV